MTQYQIVAYSNPAEVHFEYRTAAFLASVTTHFIRQCEKEDLVTCYRMIHGRKGLCFADVQKLKLIRHLHQDMGLSLDAVDFILRYRNQIKAMQVRLQEMEALMQSKERQYQAEINDLRRQLARRSRAE